MSTTMNGQSFSDVVMSLTRTLRAEVPECVASGVVDMSTGMLIAYETVDTHPTQVLDLLAGATLDMFQGRTVILIENIFKERRGVVGDRHFFQEILVNSDNLTHLFIRLANHQDIVVAAVCRRSVNVGMLFAQARRIVTQHAASL
ncbi:MAG: hypothetical protein IRZ08_00905 [Frankia sp.]|nr:hypothetical protein [Frankia sp.]